MTYALTWIPDALRQAGLRVAVVPGWETRGRGDVGETLGVICHHTATPDGGNMPTLETLIRGRSDLPGPLAQLGLGRDGTFYIVAAGRCNHAGVGEWMGTSTGNANFIGIEAENRGGESDAWPAVQMEAYRRGVAAILAHVGRGAECCAGHKEYARPIGRKSDPVFDMDEFRAAVAAILGGDAPPPPLIAAAEPTADDGTAGRPTLSRGASGPDVRQLQADLGVAVDGNFGGGTEAAVRAFQRDQGLVPDGVVGPVTWRAVDANARAVV